ncbi:MAG: elongation factor G [Deltaproteobacteria bacterium CG_4_8_14_3_um_filter_51_11]|nr:elongation factor G [bacterium]OIP41238.1 MAG: translation elongation factor G [Desulfobacteraceae bacterium CG2_30_51_40]PIP45587.1 MAG: elongation factor G [Deltaproteobacteria bacterium CG23_combo_of_CG06-09_8_20_14_all_51_20]PIX18610.1 MAG: elongation factor G [Deltaproteobacteria bacterium CG_4_8_14_3_um_filter_51_11]PIY24776.1 MAG: elongation factor G [Deltaproteobacteria bacterium CG_4_10_14_3_um_filter_51_14]PJB36815.1 MAG: elongation factor G [Deltaproteobacteria bacterium CG_4_9_1
MDTGMKNLRNIGISAHIDSGKTTLTERILYYTKRIHAIHEVKGKDGVGAKMDSMELEKERGITISSAATHCAWKGYKINIIDTPGHVDFTIEVERALRVLDGAILVLCAVGGVQSQSITVDRQMNRYRVPRLAFINKCDRSGANPFKVVAQLQERLNHNAVLMQIPIGLEGDFRGVVDLVSMKAITFEGPYGDDMKESPIPSELVADAAGKREELLDAASMFSDELMEAVFEDRVTEDLLYDALRKATLSRKLTLVFLGSAYKNIGIQLLLDGVVRLLPSPQEVKNYCLDLDQGEKEIELTSDPSASTVALAFKLEVTPYGQLTYIRIYQGSVGKGDELIISRSGKSIRVGRIVRMHADEMEDITKGYAGDIVALFGVDCYSGDTLTDGRSNYSMSSMFIPEPVISLSISPKDSKHQGNMGKAINRFTKEDPTFKSHMDPESGETIISGMGELHLDVYVERMKREFNAEVVTGMPQVAYREAITQRADFDYVHKKQTGGAGQYGRVAGYMQPGEEGKYEFVNEVKGGAIPTEYIPAVDKGFQSCLKKGGLIGFPVIGMRIAVNDGQSHSVDSSELAFSQAAVGAFRQAYMKARPVILEPIMKLAVETPSEFQGGVLASINQRRGLILSSTEDGNFNTVEAEVPLAEMFGYATVLRSMTQGKGEFTMEFSRYAKLPDSMAEELKKKQLEKTRGGKK